MIPVPEISSGAKMNKLFCLFILAFCISLNLFAARTNAQAPKRNLSNAKISPQTAVQKLRELFFNRDYSGGYEAGQKLVAQFPDNLELRAWYLANLARVPGKNAESVELAKKFAAEKGENLWTLIALIQTQSNSPKRDDLLPTAEKLIKLAPGDEEAIFSYNAALYAAKKYPESLVWMDKNASVIKDQSRFFVARANNLYQIGAAAKDTAKVKDALADLAKAIELNPNSVNANYLYGYYLNLQKRPNEAIPFLKKAVSLSPSSLDIRQLLWRYLQGQAGKTDEQKKADVIADMDSWLKANPNAPEVLSAVAEQYGFLKITEKRDAYENRILRNYPNTKYEEVIIYNRIPRIYDKHLKGIDTAKMLIIEFKSESERTADETKEFAAYNQKKREYESETKLLRWAFLKRRSHFDETKLGDVYFDLLQSVFTAKDTTDEELMQLTTGTLKYKKSNSIIFNTYIASLLNHGSTVRPNSKLNKDAEKYARAGIIEAEDKIKLLPNDAAVSSANILRGQASNTLAAALTKEGKFDEAERELIKAERLAGDEQSGFSINALRFTTDFNFAELYAAKKDYEKAETYYLKNARDNDSTKKTFLELYEKRYGKKDGFDAYYAGLKPKIKIKERERVVASRIKDAKDAIPFSLKTIDDKTVSLSDYKGKIVVINVWGVWCVPCVAEMPQFQQLYKKYENDKDVAVLTMDFNDELGTVKKFIADKKYEFPVLLGDSYVGNVFKGSLYSFPTTVFIDKQGKVAFVKSGNTGNLFEDFGWRIEALKEDK